MKNSPEFARRYQLVNFATPEGLETLLWVRKEDGRIGVKRTELEVGVPGYLFHTTNGGVSELDPDGHVGLRIDSSHPASLVGLPLDPGRWEVRVEASGDVEARITSLGGRGIDPDTQFQFELGAQTVVSMAVTLRHGVRAHLLRVLFRRIPD